MRRYGGKLLDIGSGARLTLVAYFEFQVVFVGNKSDSAGFQSEKLAAIQVFSAIFCSVPFLDIAVDLLKG